MSTGKRTLYFMLESPDCRFVLAVLRIIGIEFELKLIDQYRGQHLSEDFKKVNPFSTIPTLVEPDGYTIWESRAIATYLVQKYQPQSSLYPVDNIKIRSTIDKFLYFDIGSYYDVLFTIVYPAFLGDKPNVTGMPKYKSILKTLDAYLKQNTNPYLVYDKITLADLSLYFSLTLSEAVDMVTFDPYENVAAFYFKVGKYVKSLDKEGMFAKGRSNVIELVKTMQR